MTLRDRNPSSCIDGANLYSLHILVTHIRTYGRTYDGDTHSGYHVTALCAGERGKNHYDS
jgi:hypothetical protein